MISRSILSNYLGSLLGLAASKGLRFLAIVYCIRVVGDYTWGQSVSTLAIFSFLGFLVDQGLSASPLLFRLHDRGADQRLLGLITAYRLAMAILVISSIYLFHFLIRPLDTLILIYSFAMLPRALGIDWWFHRRELYQVTLYIATVRTLVFFMLALFFVKSGASAVTILVIEMASEAAALIFGYLLMRGLAIREKHLAPAPFGIGELLWFSSPFLVLGILNNVQMAMDILLLRFFVGPTTVAQYDVGMKIGYLYFFVGATITQIIRPKLSRLYLEGRLELLGEVLRATSSILLLASCVVLLPSLYFSHELMEMFFKKQSGLTEFVFRWASVWVCLTFMTMLATDTLLSLGHRRRYTIAALASVITNVFASLLFIKLWGAYGVVFAKMCAEGAYLTFALWFLPAHVRHRIKRLILIQGLCVAAFLTIGEGATRLERPMAGLALSLILSLGVLWKLRVFTPENLLFLKEN